MVRGEQRLILKARENELLHILIKYHPLPAKRKDIQKALWSNSYTTDSTINQAVKTLRDDLGDSERTLVRTIPKTGYILGASPTFVRHQQQYDSQLTNQHTKRSRAIRFDWLLNPLTSLYFMCGLIAFAVGYQLGVPELEEVTVVENRTHYLFQPNQIERARFSTSHSLVTYIERTEYGYRYCQKQGDALTCKNVL